MTFIVNFIATLLIWIAVDVNRPLESEIKLFSKKWWTVFLLILTAVIILKIK